MLYIWLSPYHLSDVINSLCVVAKLFGADLLPKLLLLCVL